MKNKLQNINIGSSSILMIFVVLCLVCFAALSLVSANSDYQLSKKFADKTKAYYKASNMAEESISSIDSDMSKKIKEMDEQTFLSTYGNSISFYIKVTDQQSLFVELQPRFPSSDVESKYIIKNYLIETINPIPPDENINFYNP